MDLKSQLIELVFQSKNTRTDNMSKPIYHAQSSMRRFGGVAEDYLPIHDFMDSSKGAIPDNRHRALTHNSWFLSNVIEKVFGHTITNSSNKEVSTREIAEQHVLEDFGMRFIPSAQDYLQEIEFKDWMNNGVKGRPPSNAKIYSRKTTVKRIDWD